MYRSYLIYGFMLAISACKQGDIGLDNIETPVFYVVADGSDIASLNLSGGLDDYYHFTNYEGSGMDGVATSIFAKENCPDGSCPSSLTFSFRRLAELLEDSIQVPYYTDSIIPQDQINTVFTLENLSAYSFVELFKNDTLVFASTSSTPISNPVVNLQQQVPTTIRLRGTRSNGEYGEITRTILPYGASNIFPAVSMAVDKNNTNAWIFTALSNQLNPVYQWNNGSTDSITEMDSDTSLIILTVLNNSSQGFNYPATATLAVKQTTDSTSFSTPNFSTTIVENILPYVTIRWVDKTGTLWSTDFGDQDSSAYFYLKDNITYELNEKGQKTRKFSIKFVCTLFADPGGKQNFVGSGVIAIAYP